MKKLGKINFKKILLSLFWVSLAGGVCFLLIVAFNKKDAELCTGIDIDIDGVSNHYFIDKQDIKKVIQRYSGEKIIGRPIKEFNLEKMESELEKDIWLNKAVLYFDNKGMLKIQVQEREPIARVFTLDGNSFYIDNSNRILPISNKHTTRLPIFTSFPSILKGMKKNDSSLLASINLMSLCIQKDSLLMSMIDQIDINKVGHFELVPKIGSQIILFGDTADMVKKFEKLELFYKKIIPIYGINKYNKINLQYKGQVVASIKGKSEIIADSLQTIKIMKTLAEYSTKMASDTTKNFSNKSEMSSTDISIILNSLQRDDNPGSDSIIRKVVLPTTKTNNQLNKFNQKKTNK